MHVSAHARLVRVEQVEIEGKPYYLGELLVGEDTAKPELVRFSAAPDKGGQGLIEVAKMSRIAIEAEVVGKTDYENRPYVSLRLRSFTLDTKAKRVTQ